MYYGKVIAEYVEGVVLYFHKSDLHLCKNELGFKLKLHV